MSLPFYKHKQHLKISYSLLGQLPGCCYVFIFYLNRSARFFGHDFFGNHQSRWSQGQSPGSVSGGRIHSYRCNARMLQHGCKRLSRELYVHLNEDFSLNQVFSFSHASGIDFILITSQPTRCRDQSDFNVGVCLTKMLPCSFLKRVFLAIIIWFLRRWRSDKKATNRPLLTLDYG